MTELTLDSQFSSPVRQRTQLSPPPALSFGLSGDRRNPLEGDKTMKLLDPNTNARTTSRSILRSDVAEESRSEKPSLAEIRERAFEIHIEHGGIHGCDLDDWFQAERELQEKYNESNDGRPKKK
jgi:Protein of unknown function (DUF2934)